MLSRFVVFEREVSLELWSETVRGNTMVSPNLHEERRGALDEMLWYRLYQYDPAGNRTRVDWFDGTVMRSSTYAYNALNQLTSLLGAAQGERHDVRYDANGNLARYDHDEDGQATTRYGWTTDDRLAWAQVPGAGGVIWLAVGALRSD